MDKKKIIAPLAIFCTSAVMLGVTGCSAITELKEKAKDIFEQVTGETDSESAAGGIIVSNRQGKINLLSSVVTYADETESFSPGTNYDYSLSTAYSSTRITAASTDDIPLKGVTWKVSWTDKSIGGSASDYVTLTPVTSDGLTVQVGIKQALKSKVTVTATSTENTSVFGTAEIDYVKRVITLNVGAPSISFKQTSDYTLSFGSVYGAGTLTPTVTVAYYAVFSSGFSSTANVYYEIEKQMTGAEWKTFLTSHAKDDTALTTLESGNNGYVGIVCTATVKYGDKVYQYIISDPVYPSFTDYEALIGKVTVDGNTTTIDGTVKSGTSSGSDSDSGSSSDTTVNYIETDGDSLTVSVTGGNGDLRFNYGRDYRHEHFGRSRKRRGNNNFGYSGNNRSRSLYKGAYRLGYGNILIRRKRFNF